MLNPRDISIIEGFLEIILYFCLKSFWFSVSNANEFDYSVMLWGIFLICFLYRNMKQRVNSAANLQDLRFQLRE